MGVLLESIGIKAHALLTIATLQHEVVRVRVLCLVRELHRDELVRAVVLRPQCGQAARARY